MLDLINSKCHSALKFYIEDGIKFADMQAEHLISRLAKVDSNSTLVWGLLNKHYGQDFFLHEIENEYGVSNSSSDKLQKQITAQIGQLKQTYNESLGKLEAAY